MHKKQLKGKKNTEYKEQVQQLDMKLVAKLRQGKRKIYLNIQVGIPFHAFYLAMEVDQVPK